MIRDRLVGRNDCNLLDVIITIIWTKLLLTHAQLNYWLGVRIVYAHRLHHEKWIELLWEEKFVRDTLWSVLWRTAAHHRRPVQTGGKIRLGENHLKFNYVIGRKMLEQFHFGWLDNISGNVHTWETGENDFFCCFTLDVWVNFSLIYKCAYFVRNLNTAIDEKNTSDGHRTNDSIACALFWERKNFLLRKTFTITCIFRPFTNQKIIESLGVLEGFFLSVGRYGKLPQITHFDVSLQLHLPNLKVWPANRLLLQISWQISR